MTLREVLVCMCLQVVVVVYRLHWEAFTRLISFTHQVMLMASPSMEDLYHKSCALAEDPQELRDGFQHPARLVKVNMLHCQILLAMKVGYRALKYLLVREELVGS